MCRFYFRLPGIDCTKDKRQKHSRRSRPPSAADFLCCFGVLNTVNSWKSKINLHILSISNGTIFFVRGPIMYSNFDFHRCLWSFEFPARLPLGAQLVLALVSACRQEMGWRPADSEVKGASHHQQQKNSDTRVHSSLSQSTK